MQEVLLIFAEVALGLLPIMLLAVWFWKKKRGKAKFDIQFFDGWVGGAPPTQVAKRESITSRDQFESDE